MTNVSTRYVYDGYGNLAEMYDGRGNVTRYGYDELGRQTSYADPADPNGNAGNATTYAYDALGRRISQSVRGGTATLVSWTYDAAGRVLSRAADGATTSYTYDALGNRLTAASSYGTITATYDRLNRPLTVTDSADAGAATSYTYSLTAPSWTDPAGSYSATLDAFDRQLTFREPLHAGNWTWTYRADGQPTTFYAASQVGLATTYSYDLTGQLSAKATERVSGHQARATYGYTRNRAGLILSESSTISNDPTSGQAATYSYDPLERLASYQLGSGSTTTYGWQEVPNRSSVQVGANPAVTTVFDLANRPTSASDGSSYASDVEGRLTARPGQTLSWDSLGRLTEVRNSSTNALIAAYTYDALDRLRTADNGTLRTRFRYTGLTTAVAQTVNDATGAVIRSIANDWTGTRLVDWTGTNSNQRVYGTDLHGDVTWLASDAAAVIATIRYDPWGNLANSWTAAGVSLPDFRFQGSWYDSASQLSWAVARWYAPSLGRFVSEDSLLGQPADPPSRHLYAYGAGEPVGRADTEGMFFARVLPGEDARALAYRMYGNRNLWPAIYNRNRNLYRSDPYRLLAGSCVWVEERWSPTDWYTPCSGSLANRTGYPDSRAAGAMRALGMSPNTWILLTKPLIRSITNNIVGRWENPGVIETNQYKLNMASADTIASEFIGYSRLNRLLNVVPQWCQGGHFWAQDLRTALDFVTANNCLPPAQSNDVATTIGHYVFINRSTWNLCCGQLPPDSVIAHEYIHYLQYQAGVIPFIKYAVDAYHNVNTDESYYPIESIAYLWGSWIWTYGRWGEERPWKIWRPIY